MGLNSPVYQCRLGASWLESMFEKKHLSVLVDSGLNTSQQGVLAEGSQLHWELS